MDNKLPGEVGVPLIQRGDAVEVRLSGGREMRVTVTDDGERLLVLPVDGYRLDVIRIGGGVALGVINDVLAP